MKMKTTKGFTLTELLIVMAIIVVLAAVAIPTFGKQLETARETGDMEIIRNAYTEALTIAALDAEDGKLNGFIGNGLKNGTKDGTDPDAIVTTVADSDSTKSATVTLPTNETATVGGKELNRDDFAWGSVWWAGPNSRKIDNVANTATGRYVVKLYPDADADNDIGKNMNNAHFSQATASKAWKYVSNQFMGVTAPQVDTTYQYLVFEFYITDGGSVKLVPDASEESGHETSGTNYLGAIVPGKAS